LCGGVFPLGDRFIARGPRGTDRLLGAIGLIAGLAPAALLATGTLDLHVEGAVVVYAAHAFFAGLVGLRLLLERP
jgi:hypothetical protein